MFLLEDREVDDTHAKDIDEDLDQGMIVPICSTIIFGI